MEREVITRIVFCGDLNIHHTHWDQRASRNERKGDELIDWMTEQDVI